FYRHAIPGQGFDSILFHSSGSICDKLMSVVEPNAVTSVRQNLGYETLEFQQSFFRHIMFLLTQPRALCRLLLWPIEAPSIAPSFHESFGRWPDIPSSPLRRLWRALPS